MVQIRDKILYVYCEKKILPKNFLNTRIVKHGRSRIEKINAVWIIQYHFKGRGAVKKYQYFRDSGAKTYPKKSCFLGNPYFQYYDSYELIDFEEGYL